MAVWYELRYPDYEINRLISGSGQESIEINKVMFQDNHYINDLLGNNSEIRELDWDEFYNTNSFINSLPSEERVFLEKPRYQSQIRIGINGRRHHYLLTSNGYIRTFHHSNKISINDKDGKYFDFIDINIEKFLSFLKHGNFELSESDVKYIEDEIQRYKNKCYAKNEILNCVMYRIIERGGNRIGSRRAFLFAKEFGRNIDIPMTYGVDYSDPGLRTFMNEYIKEGGSKDLECYVGYFSRASKYEKLDIITISELIKTQSNNAATFYTSEEDGLHQRLINALSNQINQDELFKEQQRISKEEIKQLRIQRKLEKVRKK